MAPAAVFYVVGAMLLLMIDGMSSGRMSALRERSGVSEGVWVCDSLLTLAFAQSVALLASANVWQWANLAPYLLGAAAIPSGLIAASELVRHRRPHPHLLATTLIALLWILGLRLQVLFVGAFLLVILEQYESALRGALCQGRTAPLSTETFAAFAVWVLALVSLWDGLQLVGHTRGSGVFHALTGTGALMLVFVMLRMVAIPAISDFIPALGRPIAVLVCWTLKDRMSDASEQPATVSSR